MTLDELYFDRIFASFRTTLEAEGKPLPSVSLMALEKQGDPFAILVSTVISLRTKDRVTLEASKRLLKVADSPQKLVRLETEEIEKLIYPAGFYKRKAAQLKNISKDLIERFKGAVPSSSEELLSLPGVGIKTANLVLNLGFGIDAVCVDCHVHEIANRLGWINTKTPEESVKALEEIMPKKYWIPLNELLVSYGQTICLPVSPFCSKCGENEVCPKTGVRKSR